MFLVIPAAVVPGAGAKPPACLVHPGKPPWAGRVQQHRASGQVPTLATTGLRRVRYSLSWATGQLGRDLVLCNTPTTLALLLSVAVCSALPWVLWLQLQLPNCGCWAPAGTGEAANLRGVRLLFGVGSPSPHTSRLPVAGLPFACLRLVVPALPVADALPGLFSLIPPRYPSTAVRFSLSPSLLTSSSRHGRYSRPFHSFGRILLDAVFPLVPDQTNPPSFFPRAPQPAFASSVPRVEVPPCALSTHPHPHPRTPPTPVRFLSCPTFETYFSQRSKPGLFHSFSHPDSSLLSQPLVVGHCCLSFV